MKSKKGFTLIELLAIIVILAIIAVITVPIILNIIEDSQKGAAKDSAYGFKDSINKYYVSELAKDPHFHLEDGTYTVSELNGSAVLTGEEAYTISLSGTVPTSGTIVIENNDITSGNIQIGDYCIDLSNMEVTKGECGDTPIANATPERCFEYEVKKELTVSSVDECATILMGIGLFEQEQSEMINEICSGETVEDMNLSQLLFMLKSMMSIDLISQYPNVFEDNELNEIEITGYKCGGQVTEFEEQIVLSYTAGEHMDVVIPNKIAGKNVTSIGMTAFSSLDLTTNEISTEKKVIINSITIPNSVEEIGVAAFHGNKLTSVEIPNSVTKIGMGAFINNELTSVVIPNSVTTIEAGSFNKNNLPDNQAIIYARNDDGTIDTTTIVSYGGANKNPSIPDGVTSIGDNAFAGNQLTNITMPNSVTEIGEEAFFNNQLTNITIPNSVTTIGESAFYHNHDLTINVIGYTSAPSGWDNDWNSDYPVNWNYQG